MSTKRMSVSIAAALVAALTAGTVSAELQLPRVSPAASVSQTVGVTEITITYSRPGVKGRVIWGDLVPYGKVWRTGANEATTIAFADDVTIDGHALPAGRYSLATIPTPETWTVIFNKVADMWGMYTYKAEEDALRITVKPRTAPFTEWLTFGFPELTPDSAVVAMTWEKLEVPFTVKVDVVATTVAKARAAVAAAPMDDWQTPYRAAAFLIEHDADTGEAQTWLERSIMVKETFANLGLKARFLAKGGDFKDAVETGKRAIELGRAAHPPANTKELGKLVAEWESKAK